MKWPVSPAKEWTAHGLQCALIPTPSMPMAKGPYNGYVRVPSGHPDAGRGYDDVDVDVWGGLTFAAEDDEDGGTWFGWDDCHCDLCPRSAKEETEELARQLAARVPRKVKP